MLMFRKASAGGGGKTIGFLGGVGVCGGVRNGTKLGVCGAVVTTLVFAPKNGTFVWRRLAIADVGNGVDCC